MVKKSLAATNLKSETFADNLSSHRHGASGESVNKQRYLWPHTEDTHEDWSTVDQEIFAVKIFLSVYRIMKIKHVKN